MKSSNSSMILPSINEAKIIHINNTMVNSIPKQKIIICLLLIITVLDIFQNSLLWYILQIQNV